MAYSIYFAVDGNIADDDIGDKFPCLWKSVFVSGMNHRTESGNYYWGWTKPRDNEEYERSVFKEADTYIKDGHEVYLSHDGSVEELQSKIESYGFPELRDYVVKEPFEL